MKKLVVLLSVVFVLLISGCTGYKTDPTPPYPQQTTEPTVQPTSPPQLCIQVITPAQDPVSGECRDFSTPCDVPEGWVAGCAPAAEKNVTATILVGENATLTLNGVEHIVKFLGAESSIEAAMQVDRFGTVYLKGRLLNVTGNKGKIGVYVDSITVRPAVTRETSVTVTLVDLNATFGGTAPTPTTASGY